MSQQPRPAHELRAPTISEGLNDYQEQREGRAVILAELNRRLPNGPSVSTEGIILPNEPEMAQSMIRYWRTMPMICVRQEVNSIVLDNAHVDEDHSLYLFGDNGWYAATPTCVEDLLVA